MTTSSFGDARDHRDQPDATQAPGGESLALDVESIWQALEGQRAPPSVDPLIDATIGGVTLIRLIAEGGMGRVYEGEQREPLRTVAVKVLRPGLVSRELLRRFLNESAILGRLRHRGITQVHAAGTCDVAGAKVPFFVMEFVPGALPITDYCRRHELPPSVIIGLFRQACDAVASAHRLGVVHRDLTPGNVLVDADGHPRIIDFGIARRDTTSERGTMLTEHGRLLGTLQYMSPEQCSGTTNADARSDVYSLGMLLYELLAGAPPYDLGNRSVADAARVITDVMPATLRSRAPMISRRIARIVDRCLSKEPASRYPDADHLSEALAKAMAPSWSPADWLPDLPRLGTDRSRHLPHGVLVGVLGGLLTLLAVNSVSDWATVERAWADVVATVSPSHRIPAPWHVVDPDGSHHFAAGFRNVFQDGSDEFLVSQEGVRRWEETSRSPTCTYWGPAGSDGTGWLVYRFPFDAPARRIHLRAESNCWDFDAIEQASAEGRGASSLEVSKDGEDWVTIRDTIEPRRWGESWLVDEDLPAGVTGGTCLWVRLRFLATGVPADADYTVAQFGRSSAAATADVFSVVAELEPAPP